MAKPELPFYAPEELRPMPTYLSQLPRYEPVGEFQPIKMASDSDVPSIAAINANNPPCYRSDYNPLCPYFHASPVDVDQLIIAYNKMPKRWLEGRKGKLEFYVARAKALDYHPSQQQQQEEEEHREGEEQPIKKPRPSREPYVLPPPQAPSISVRDFTKEEREIYNKMVVESDGFDCPYVPREIAVPGLLKPVPVGGLKGLEDKADLALKSYNDHNGTSYQLVKIIKATVRADGGITYNITFQAKDDATGSSPRNFQARVTLFVDSSIKVFFCRVEQESKPPGGPEETSQ